MNHLSCYSRTLFVIILLSECTCYLLTVRCTTVRRCHWPNARISPKLHDWTLLNFCACYPRLWLDLAQAASRYVIYFRFCRWRHIPAKNSRHKKAYTQTDPTGNSNGGGVWFSDCVVLLGDMCCCVIDWWQCTTARRCRAPTAALASVSVCLSQTPLGSTVSGASTAVSHRSRAKLAPPPAPAHRQSSIGYFFIFAFIFFVFRSFLTSFLYKLLTRVL